MNCDKGMFNPEELVKTLKMCCGLVGYYILHLNYVSFLASQVNNPMDHAVKYCLTGISLQTKVIASGWEPHTHTFKSRDTLKGNRVLHSALGSEPNWAAINLSKLFTAQKSSWPHKCSVDHFYSTEDQDGCSIVFNDGNDAVMVWCCALSFKEKLWRRESQFHHPAGF